MIAFQRAEISVFPVRRGGSQGWRICVVWLGVSALAVLGCQESVMTKTLPAPIRGEVKHEMVGSVYRVWAGDRFEFGDEKELHCIVLRGLDVPGEDQPNFFKARNTLNAILRSKTIRVNVIDRDEMMREEADVFVIQDDSENRAEQRNVGLRMIELGWGWYDGNEFEGVDSFRIAQQEARAKKLGVWAQDSTHPPWEFKNVVNRGEVSEPGQSELPDNDR